MKLRYKIQNDHDTYLTYNSEAVFITGDTVVSKYDIEPDNYSGRRLAAAECAEHFWNEFGGEDHGWPLRFTLLGDGDKELGTYEVDVDTAPKFSASEA